jgi:hypothetical protein
MFYTINLKHIKNNLMNSIFIIYFFSKFFLIIRLITQW